MRARRSVLVRLVVLLLCAVTGALAGAGIGFLVLAGERCAGPACAGLIVIPMLTALPGAAAGAVAGAVLWIRRIP
jgi:hypothetical protein